MSTLADQLEARLREELARADATDTHGANASLDAALEAEGIEKAAELLIEHEGTRSEARPRIVTFWRWTRFPGLNPERDWPPGIDAADVAEWFEEGRARAASKVGWVAATEAHGVELVVRVGTPPERHQLSTEQLAWLYSTLPESVRMARTVRRRIAQIASGEAHSELLELIPSALGMDSESASDAESGALADGARLSIKAFQESACRAALPVTAEQAVSAAKALDEAFAVHLGNVGNELASELATWLLEKSRQRKPEDAWYAWGKDRAVAFLLRALWRENAEQRKRPIRFSSPLANTFAAARMLRPVDADADIIVEAPRGLTLTLPFGEALTQSPGSRGLVTLRRVLDGAALRTYLATLAIFGDTSGLRTDGLFSVEGDQILDLIGAPRFANTRRGVTTQIYQSRDRKAVEMHLQQFAVIRVRAIGDAEATAGDALVDSIHERSTRKLRYYAHSRLIVQHMLKDYMRVPKAVCALAADDVPLALSLTGTVRQRVFQNLKDGKPIEAPIAELAAGAGLDLAPQVRKHGLRYLDELAEDFSRVADAGEIGSVQRFGAGRDAVLVITPREALLHSYKPLLIAAAGHAKAKRAALTADKRGPRTAK
jgi:hypothetical protein